MINFTHLNKLVRLFIGLVLLVNVNSKLNATELKDIRLQLKWHHQFQFAGYYAAQIKGFYEKEGLNVKIVEGSANRNPLAEVLKGNADFGVSGADILDARIQNKPVVVTSVIFQHTPYVIISLEKSKISTLSDLVDKKVMVAEGQGELLIRALMMREGIPINRIEFVQHTWDNNDLISGRVDAMSGYTSYEPFLIKQQGYKVKLIRPTDYGLDFYGDLIFTTHRLIARDPRTVQAFNRASVEGWKYALEHEDELITYILTLPGIEKRGISRESLKYEAAEIRKLIMPDLVEIGHINPDRWRQMLNVYQQLKIAPKGFTLDGFLFNPNSLKEEASDIMIGFIVIILILALGSLVWNRQLKQQVDLKALELRREIEQRAQTEESLQFTLSAANLGLWQWDVQTSTILFNEQWATMLGYDKDQVPRSISEWQAIVHPDDIERTSQSAEALLNSDYSSDEITYRVKDGKGDWRWVMSLRKVNRNGDNKPLRITGIHFDIDQLKKTEVELKELTKELMKKNSELEKFAYIISHNLRAPVVNLKSLTDLYAEGDLPEEMMQELFSKIKECVQILGDTLNDLVEIVSSKLGEAAKREKLNLETELTEVMRSIESQIQNANALIEYDFSEATYVNFPKRYLQSILLNLLTNAIKYRSPDRRLHIRVKAFPHKGFTIVKFSDNGLGMDKDKIKDKIFGLYQRFHPGTEGRGLGLYIVKSQLESFDGRIGVESVVNEGTTFKLYFHDALSKAANYINTDSGT